MPFSNLKQATICSNSLLWLKNDNLAWTLLLTNKVRCNENVSNLVSLKSCSALITSMNIFRASKEDIFIVIVVWGLFPSPKNIRAFQFSWRIWAFAAVCPLNPNSHPISVRAAELVLFSENIDSFATTNQSMHFATKNFRLLFCHGLGNAKSDLIACKVQQWALERNIELQR